MTCLTDPILRPLLDSVQVRHKLTGGEYAVKAGRRVEVSWFRDLGFGLKLGRVSLHPQQPQLAKYPQRFDKTHQEENVLVLLGNKRPSA